MTNAEDWERALLDEYEPRWLAQGYKVIRHPSAEEVPKFLGYFRPDALALGQDVSLVVEVIRKGSPNAEEKVRRLKALLEPQERWRLEVLYSGEAESGLPPAESDAISELLEAARTLYLHEPRGALLLTWAALEALARRLEPQASAKPQSPGRVVELLASTGHVAPSEAERLRAAVNQRNRLIHGDLSVRPPPSDVSEILEIARNLLLKLEGRKASEG